MTRFVPVCLAALVLLLAPLGTLAQYEEDDEQTRDYESQDRRYEARTRAVEQAPDSIEEAEQEFLAHVDRLIRDRNYRAANSDRYRVQSDDPRIDPRAVVELLETFRRFFDEFWSERIELRPYEKQSRIFLFYSFYKYNQLLGGDFRFSPIRPKGHYGSLFDVVTLHTDADTAADFADTVIHEAAHQLVDQRFDWNGGTPPIWVSEGLASYFGYTYMNPDGKFLAGKIGRKSVSLFKVKTRQRPLQGDQRLRRVRQELKQRDPIEGGIAARLIRTRTPARFYGGDSDLNYGLSWVLVHYLLHGDDGAHVAAFVRYLERVGQGDDAPDLLFSELGVSAGELDDALARHVKGMKVR